MDIPLIRKFACGYVGGVKSVDPDAKVYQNMTGTTGAAWNDPVKGGELAKSQFDQGADVVYHAAGGTGIGVLQAAADAGKLGIGVDSNQNGLHPGQVLTSMLKRVDIAVQETFTDAMNGEFTPGFEVLGLAEGGVGWALDDNNAELITAEMLAAVEEATAAIVAGEVVVHDYMADELPLLIGRPAGGRAEPPRAPSRDPTSGATTMRLLALGLVALAAPASAPRLPTPRSSTPPAASSTPPSTRRPMRAPSAGRRRPAEPTPSSSRRRSARWRRRCAALPAAGTTPSSPSASCRPARSRGRARVPRGALRHRRRGGGRAERPVGRLQGA
jgi:hypothetical protein